MFVCKWLMLYNVYKNDFENNIYFRLTLNRTINRGAYEDNQIKGTAVII